MRHWGLFKHARLSLGAWHQALLVLALTALTFGGVSTLSASQTTLLVADRELDNYWRTSYDILVRPEGVRSQIEERYGLVEPNHLSGIWGGISFEQYEAIKSIPGVEVVAPIAMIGYVPNLFLTEAQGVLSNPGVYILEQLITTDDGSREYQDIITTYYYTDPGSSYGLAQPSGPIPQPLGSDVKGFLFIPLLLAGIDARQETALVGLENALVEGQYLTEEEQIYLGTYTGSLFQSGTPRITVPTLINLTPYITLKMHLELRFVSLPDQDFSLENIMAQGGNAYLSKLPSDILNFQELRGSQMYQWMLERLREAGGVLGEGLHASPAPILYRESIAPFSYNGLTLEVIPPRTPQEKSLGGLSYRETVNPHDTESQLNAVYSISIKGVFDIEQIRKPTQVNRVPLETYFPPVALLRYDEQGNPVDPPRELRPTLNPAGYIQTPPLLVTNLEAARALRGESAISAIRVRVALDHCPPEQPEACTLTDADQRKIEAIAIEIQRRTGLDVDIMVGSSPTRVLVHVPEIGYVEEQWIQKGVSLVYSQGIQTGNWLLLGTLLLAGSLFTLDLTWAEVLSRRRLIALQKALGWRSRTVFTQIVGQVVMIGAIATVTGTLIALALIRILNWQPLPLAFVIALPFVIIALCVIGSLVPAWSASRVPPVAELQRGGVRYARRQSVSVSNLWQYSWNEIKRRTTRSLLTGIASALSAALLVLLLAVTLQQRGMLGGTLLGEFILMSIERFHYVIVAIGFGLAALSTFNGLLNGILERRREIGVLKAVGWRTVSVARLFILQGLLLGMASGSLGALVGMLAYFYLYRSISSDLLLVILLGISVPGLVGALAAIYPARLAAKVPPAEAVRYE